MLGHNTACVACLCPAALGHDQAFLATAYNDCTQMVAAVRALPEGVCRLERLLLGSRGCSTTPKFQSFCWILKSDTEAFLVQ